MISIEDLVLENGCETEGLEADGEEMHDVVVLYVGVVAEEEDDGYVEEGEYDHFEVEGLSEDGEEHEEDDDEMAGVFVQFGQSDVLIAEGVDQ